MTSTAVRSYPGPRTQHTVSAVGVIASEWIKLRSLRSSRWMLGMVLLAGPAITVPLCAFIAVSGGAGQAVALISSIWLAVGQILVAVTGVLSMSSEYGTGAIRSSLAAVPARLPVLWSKAVILFTICFVLGAVASLLSRAAAVLVLSARGIIEGSHSPDLIGSALLCACGSGLYLGLVAVFALGVGTIVRASAGSIVLVLAVFFVLPPVVSIVQSTMRIDWMSQVDGYLLSNAGSGLASPTDLDPTFWQNGAVALCWAVVSVIAAALTMRSRDT
ncbi:ABC transporter permease [Leifsonia sp. SIMBA_070]|uniref:ABC transporter permease n=1 Tax=Leifsonia sp. SIMBA_070 TaxID=3085810 RepID=UPI00397AEBED